MRRYALLAFVTAGCGGMVGAGASDTTSSPDAEARNATNRDVEEDVEGAISSLHLDPVDPLLLVGDNPAEDPSTDQDYAVRLGGEDVTTDSTFAVEDPSFAAFSRNRLTVHAPLPGFDWYEGAIERRRSCFVGDDG